MEFRGVLLRSRKIEVEQNGLTGVASRQTSKRWIWWHVFGAQPCRMSVAKQPRSGRFARPRFSLQPCRPACGAGTDELPRAHGGNPPEAFEESLFSTILYHSGGPMILPGAPRPEESDDVTPDLIARAVTVLRKTFRYVVVDMGIAIDDSTLPVLDLTQHGTVVTAPE